MFIKKKPKIMQYGPYTIDIKNRDKIFFPEKKITKGQLIDYYDKVAEYLLPFMEDRPLTLNRYPDGIEGEGFYQKECPDYFADWIKVMKIKKEEGGTIPQIICNNKATLVYLVNEGTISFHPWLSDASNIRQPNKLVFDLDPPKGNFDLVLKGAKTLRSLLEDELELHAFPMTTGSEGMHVVVPIRPTKEFEEVRSFAKKIAEYLSQEQSDSFTAKVRKDQRNGRLFIDYLRNGYAQTAISPYSVRAIEGAPVATPLDWDELNQSGLSSQSYHINNIFNRLGQKAHPWPQFRNKAKKLDDSIKKLEKLSS